MVPLFWRSENGGRCEVKRAMLTTNRALLCTVKERFLSTSSSSVGSRNGLLERLEEAHCIA